MKIKAARTHPATTFRTMAATPRDWRTMQPTTAGRMMDTTGAAVNVPRTVVCDAVRERMHCISPVASRSS
jgi:hypothetical protein